MDNAQAQIEELKQTVALLRDRLACAEAKITDCQTSVAELEEVAKSEILKMLERVRHVDNGLSEVQQFIWPVVEKVFPKMLKSYVDVGDQFRAPKTDYRESKRD